jgi:hypothetical protein
MMSLTLGTVCRCRDLIIAIMALQRTILQVVGEGHTAVGAFEGETTIRTENKIRKPSSIEKEEALLFLFDIFLQGYLHLF